MVRDLLEAFRALGTSWAAAAVERRSIRMPVVSGSIKENPVDRLPEPRLGWQMRAGGLAGRARQVIRPVSAVVLEEFRAERVRTTRRARLERAGPKDRAPGISWVAAAAALSLMRTQRDSGSARVNHLRRARLARVEFPSAGRESLLLPRAAAQTSVNGMYRMLRRLIQEVGLPVVGPMLRRASAGGAPHGRARVRVPWPLKRD